MEVQCGPAEWRFGQALGRPRSASCWVDSENAGQGLGGLSSRELLSCPSRPEWLRLECDFEPGGDRHFSGLGVIRQLDAEQPNFRFCPSQVK